MSWLCTAAQGDDGQVPHQDGTRGAGGTGVRSQSCKFTGQYYVALIYDFVQFKQEEYLELHGKRPSSPSKSAGICENVVSRQSTLQSVNVALSAGA